MNNLKRSYTSSSKNTTRYSGKPREMSKSSGSRYKVLDVHLPGGPSEPRAPVLSAVKQFDNTRLLPRYAAVLGRTFDDGVGMEDLDHLQQDLEKLLSTVAVRRRTLKSEIESIDRVEERRKNKKGKLYKKHQPLKRKRPDERTKCKEVKNGRILKTKHTLPVNSFVNDLPLKREVPKVSFPKNDTSDRFWLSAEPYCADISKEDVIFLDGLIQECSRSYDIKIPDLGEHYSISWKDEMLGHERNLGAQRSPKFKQFNSELKKNGLNAMVDTFSSPLTQRLIEATVVTKFPRANDNGKLTDFSLAKLNNGARNGICMDRRLRQELVEQGILDIEDLSKAIPPDDDIVVEIKKCMQELKIINEKNVTELKKLRTMVAKDVRRQDVKNALNKVDNEVMEMYNKILMSKQNHSPQTDEEPYDKLMCLTNDIVDDDDEEEDVEEATKIIQQQAILHKELMELSNATTLF